MRRLVMFVIVLVLLAAVADRVVWLVARQQIATAVQQDNGLSKKPSVGIDGFPLLTQAVKGHYDHVSVDADDFKVEGGITLDDLQVDLRGVDLPLRDLTSGGATKVPVDHADILGRIGYESLTKIVQQQINNQSVKLTLEPGPSSDTIKVTGTFSSALFNGALSGDARVVLNGGDLVVTVLPESLTTIPGPFRDTVAGLLGVTLQVPTLPFGLEAKSLSVKSSGVVFQAAGDDVVLDTTQS